MRLFFSAASVLALTAFSAASAFAAGDRVSPETAAALAPTAVADGSINGSIGGGFQYFTIQPQPDLSQDTLTLALLPDDPTTNAVGVNLYQDGQLVGSTNGVGFNLGMASVSVAPTTTDPILVQLFSYIPGETPFRLGLEPGTAIAPIGPMHQPVNPDADEGGRDDS